MLKLRDDILKETTRHLLTEFSYFRGRVALAAILKALEIGQGDEVAMQAFTCLAVVEGIQASGATPLYIDIEAGSVNIDVVDLEGKLTKRTRAIVVQHTFGIPANAPALREIAERHNIALIEDCCHTFGSMLNGISTGTFGIASFYSFEWGKPLVVGLGGSAVINDDSLQERVREQYRNYEEPPFGRVARIQIQYAAFRILFRPRFYWPLRTLFRRLSSLGTIEGNYTKNKGIASDFSLRMAGPCLGRLKAKIGGIANGASQREAMGARYRDMIRSQFVAHIPIPKNARAIYSRYPLFTDHKSHILEKARRAGVEVADWYASPIHPLQGANPLASVSYALGQCPRAEWAADRIITLPMHERTSDSDVNRVIEFLNKVCV